MKLRKRLPCFWLALVCAVTAAAQNLSYRSPFLAAKADPARPALSELSVDSLGKGALEADRLQAPPADGVAWRVVPSGASIGYARGNATQAAWTIRFHPHEIDFESRWDGESAPPVELTFDPQQAYATLLGRTAGPERIALPALLHLPGMGSLRIDASGSPYLAYDAKRQGRAFIRIGFPAAGRDHPRIRYRLRVVDISPRTPPGLTGAASDGFHRSFLDLFQLNAEWNVLANNAASDPCPFTLYMYADLAAWAPHLARGLTVMDLVRSTLDRYLDGFKGYGMPGYQAFDSGPSPAQPYRFADIDPSLLIAAADVFTSTRDAAWAAARYPALRERTEAMLATDTTGDGLIKYPASGNSGSWRGLRPANWWDTIGFGYEDAYANALAFRALEGMSSMAATLGHAEDARRYAERARKLRAAYKTTFFHPETGLVAGWKSQDGHLHDYAFTFVNGIAIRYGLIDEPDAQQILTHMLAAFARAGYTRFDLGIPGNLLPIRRDDYTVTDPRWGAPQSADGRDGFEVYENGGATACFAYFLVSALQQEKRPEGQAMLNAILSSISRHGFSGRAPNGMTYDWKDWQGGAHGYEGMLVDNYYVLLAALPGSPDHRQKTVAAW